jgi:deoxyribonuclease-4
MRRLGVHISIAGGVNLSPGRAKKLGCTTMQIFSHNPRGWARRNISALDAGEFRRFSEDLDIKPAFIHSSYLINLASPHDGIRRKSISLLSYELSMADLLGIDHVVLHPGKAVGQEIKVAVRKASDALKAVYNKVECRAGILIENTAGQRGDISSSIPLLSDIISGVPPGLVKGICLDTCHAYSAGYDIVKTEGLNRLKNQIKKYLSPLKVELIHLNDAKKGLSSGIDRHEHIGKGSIGISGFKKFLSFPYFRDVPLVLETPKESEYDDRANMKRVVRILKGIR